MSNKVNGVNANSRTNQSKAAARPAQITVKRGDTVTSLAKKFGMSKDEFMNWAGLKNTALKIGQKISLPTDSVPQGKGLIALAKKHNMTLDEFCKLNGISKNYQPSKGEIFYVKTKQDTVKSTPQKPTAKTPATKAPEAKKTTPKTKASTAKPASSVAGQVPVLGMAGAVKYFHQNIEKWGTPFTPQEIASKLEQEADDRWGAVGKEVFDNMIDQINPKNAAEVIKAYDALGKDRTLINRITSEVNSSKEKRKAAVMHIYDALAAAKGTPDETRVDFKEILDKEFSKLFGMVNTEKLDAIITSMLKTPSPSTTVTNDSSKIKISNGKTFSVSELQRSAIASAKKEAQRNFESYCKAQNIKYDPAKLDLSPMDRIPAPIHRGEKITSYNSGLLKPKGKPNGKVVILNPGHGGYSTKNGFFDVGAFSFIKKSNGKYAPILEYEKMNKYAQETAESLRQQGYAVIIANSHIDTMASEHLISNLISNLNNGKMGGQKYAQKDISFISLHADSEPGKSGTGICFDPGSTDDKKLKDSMLQTLNSDDWISAKGSERPKLHVIKETANIPSVLVEVEYVNGPKSSNLESARFQTRFIDNLIAGLNAYYGIN